MCFNPNQWLAVEYSDTLLERESLAKDLIKENNVLLFIDNYETIDVRESRIAKFIKELPSGVKTLITSRHLPVSVPAVDIFVDPLDRREAEILAVAEAQAQHVGAGTVERFLDDILRVSAHVPLAIKWIIGCSKNPSHMRQLLEDHKHGKPTLDNLCEFCFTFEYNLLSSASKKALVLFPMFKSAPSAREMAVAADVDEESMNAALDELAEYSLVVREHSPTRGEEVFRIMRLTASFASSKLSTFPDLDRQARRRLKSFYGVSIPVLLEAAKEMVNRGVTAPARQYIDEEILDRDPTNALALYLKGQTLEREFQDTLALAEYDKAMANAGEDSRLVCDLALRMSALSAKDPQKSREEQLPLLERAYGISRDNRIAIEIARICQMIEKPERAREYYSKVYKNYVVAQQELWEEAALFLCQDLREGKSVKAALEFIQQSLRACPGSKALVALERTLLDESGVTKRFGKQS